MLMMESCENILYNRNNSVGIRRSDRKSLKNAYSLDIQFYTSIPPPITAEELMDIVTERIYVLKVINSVVRDIGYKQIEQKCRVAAERLKSIGSYGYVKLINSKGHRTYCDEDFEIRIIDHTSFVMLSLALIRDEQFYEYLQKVEEEFFNIRLSNLDEEGMRELLKLYNKYPQITGDEKKELEASLINFLDNPKNYDSTELFKVPISIVLGFLNPHEIYFDRGIAIIPFDKMRAVLRGLFREYLEQQVSNINMHYLKYCNKLFDQSEKFRDIFQEIYAKFKQVQQYSLRDGTILAFDIDGLVSTSFPPCMRAIHETLRLKHHLKHESRLQYTLFLKGIGVPVDETVKLFRKEFLKKVSTEQFNKEYKYYIEHAYGFRGNKHDYDPQSCMQIQSTPTAFRDCNGCLFSSTYMVDIEDLDIQLTHWNISNSDRREIIERTKSGNCGYACAQYFEATNDCSLGQSVKHPNQYFKDSRYVRANGIIEYRCEYEQDDSDEENYGESYPEPITDYLECNEELNQLRNHKSMQETSQSVIKTNQNSISAERYFASTSESILNAPTAVKSTADKKVANSSSTAITSVSSNVNMTISTSTVLTMSDNNQPFAQDTFKFIRKSMVVFDDLIGVENIRCGSIIKFTPKGEDDDSDDSDDSPLRKQKRSV